MGAGAPGSTTDRWMDEKNFVECGMLLAVWGSLGTRNTCFLSVALSFGRVGGSSRPHREGSIEGVGVLRDKGCATLENHIGI